MKTLLFLALSTLSLTASGVPGWKLVWSDEFDKPGQPDPAKWAYEKGMLRNNEKQFCTDNRRENARVEDGRLVIEARREKMDRGEYTSASLVTKGHAEWTYGRVEVRAKLPAARGTWPAIWMLPDDHGKTPWPKCGEIDIMEHVGYDPGVIHGSLHSEAFNHVKGTQRTGILKVPDASAGFHDYTLEWTADRILFGIDGRIYASFDRKPGDKVAEWPFDKPFYLILNLAVGGSWGGAEGDRRGGVPTADGGGLREGLQESSLIRKSRRGSVPGRLGFRLQGINP